MIDNVIKYEFKKVAPPTCLMVGISVVILWGIIYENIKNNISIYIQGNDILPFINIFMQPYRVLIGLLGICIAVVVHQQFDKNMEYKQGMQVKCYTHKIFVGVLSIFITFLITLVSAWILYSKYYYFQQQTYIGVMFENQFKNSDSFINIVGILSNGYIVILIWYIFLTIIRHSVDNAKTSIYIGCCIGLSIAHILLAIQTYINIIIGDSGKIKILSYYTNLIDGLIVPIQREFEMHENELWWVGDKLRDDYYIQNIIMICIILLVINIGIMMAKKYDSKLGRSILSNKYIEYILRGYITLYIGLLPLNFMSIFLRDVHFNIYIVSIVTIIFILIGKFIAWQINWEKRVCVNNDIDIEYKSQKSRIIPLTIVILLGISQLDNIDSAYNIKYGVMKSVEEEEIFQYYYSNSPEISKLRRDLNEWNRNNQPRSRLYYQEYQQEPGIVVSIMNCVNGSTRNDRIGSLNQGEFKLLEDHIKYSFRQDMLELMDMLVETKQESIVKIYTDKNVRVQINKTYFGKLDFDIYIFFEDYIANDIDNTTCGMLKARGYEVQDISTYTKLIRENGVEQEFKINKIDYMELFTGKDSGIFDYRIDNRMVDEGPANKLMVNATLLEEKDEVIGASIFIEKDIDKGKNTIRDEMILQGHHEEFIHKIGNILKIEGLEDKIKDEIARARHKSLEPCIIKDDEYEVRIMYCTRGQSIKKHNMRIDIFKNEN